MRRLALCVGIILGACQSSPDLTTTEQYAVVMSPTSHDFGSLQVGQMSAAFTFTANPPVGNNSDTITAVSESCPDFSVSALGLPATVYRTCETCCTTCIICCTSDFESYSFDTFFKPTVGGAVSCVVTLTLSSGTTKTVTISGTGTLPPIDIDVVPSSVGFGDVRVNTDSSASPITVRNVGGQTLTVNSATISAGFTIMSGPTGSYNVAPGGSQSYSVVCHPTANGTVTGNFVVSSNDPSTPTVSVPLSCRGVSSALNFSPSPATLPTTRVGEPIQADIQIQNTGTASMSFEGVTLTGADFSLVTTPSNGTISAGGSKTARVAFAAATAGSQVGMLTVTYDGGQTRINQVNARALETSMAMSPDGDIDFGPICADTSKSETFTIVANNDGAFRITQIAAGAPFTVTAPALPANVLGNAANKVEFDVAAMPTAAGPQMAEMTVTTDIPGSSPRTLNLSVDAIPAGVNPTPELVEFGSTEVDTTTIAQQAHLSNCSTGAVTISGARIEGKDAAEFAIVATPDSASIAPSGVATWLVVLSGKTTGPKEATLVIEHSEGLSTVPLQGEVLGDTGSGSGSNENPIDERSYYSCSTGAPTSSWLVAVALVLIVRRRRR